MKLDLRVIGTVPAIVPIRPKGGVWTLQQKKLPVLEGQSEAEIGAFAAAISRALVAYREAHPSVPGDGKIESRFRAKRKRGEGSARVDRMPASVMHRHSKRCLVPLTEVEYGRYPDPPRTIELPGWSKCKLVPYPYQPLHEHRTKRGRTFLVSHLTTAKCPFDRAEGGQS